MVALAELLADVEVVEIPPKIVKSRSLDRHKEREAIRNKRYKNEGKKNTRTNRRIDPSEILKCPILFLDGEGLDRGEAVHYRNWSARHGKGGDNNAMYQPQDYVLLTVQGDDGTNLKLKHDDWSRLTTRECLEFLINLWTPHKRFIVGFGLNYDFSMILRDLPLKTILRLKDEEHRNYARWRKWSLQLIPNVSLTITERLKKGDTRKPRTVKIWDTYTFFQSSFVVAAEKCGLMDDPSRVELLKRMKARRSEFKVEEMPEIERYNDEECVVGIEMFNKVRHHWLDLGLSLQNYHGAGAVAAAMLRKNSVKEYMDRDSEGMTNPRDESLRCPECSDHRDLCTDIIARAYFGGRFDYARQGFMGDVHEYDINSAYPYEASRLPCLSHARWIRHSGAAPIVYGIYRVAWDSASTWAPFPYRLPNSAIRYYSNGCGYYYRDEVVAAQEFANLDIQETWELRIECDHQPLAWVEEYYQQRAELKERGDYGEKIIKLGLNAIAGKFAQKVGVGGQIPSYQNYIWAGIITSNTRARLMQVAARDPQAITHMATDGIYSTRELPLDTDSSKLGAWEHKELRDLVLVCNGVYSDLEQHKNAHRGYAPHQIPWAELRSQFTRGDFVTPIQIQDHDFVGLTCVGGEAEYERRCTWKTAIGRMRVTPKDDKIPASGGEWLRPSLNPTPDVLSSSAGR